MGIVRPGYGPQPLWWCRGAANSACALAAQRGVRYSAPAGSDGGKRHDRIGKKRSSISYGHCQLDQSIPPPVTVPAAPECRVVAHIGMRSPGDICPARHPTRQSCGNHKAYPGRGDLSSTPRSCRAAVALGSDV